MNEILKTINMLRCFLRVKQEDWAFIESSVFLSEIVKLIKKQLQIWESLLQIDGINSKGEVLLDIKEMIKECEMVEKTI